MVNRTEQMAADTEEVLYDAVHRCDALQLGGWLVIGLLRHPQPNLTMPVPETLGSGVAFLDADGDGRQH